VADFRRLPLADLIAAHRGPLMIEDHRVRFGYVLVRCPNDDGTNDHALHVCNPHNELPAHAYCLSEACKSTTTEQFLEWLELSIGLH